MQRAVAMLLIFYLTVNFHIYFVKGEKQQKKKKNGHVIYASMIVSVVAVPKF